MNFSKKMDKKLNDFVEEFMKTGLESPNCQVTASGIGDQQHCTLEFYFRNPVTGGAYSLKDYTMLDNDDPVTASELCRNHWKSLLERYERQKQNYDK